MSIYINNQDDIISAEILFLLPIVSFDNISGCMSSDKSIFSTVGRQECAIFPFLLLYLIWRLLIDEGSIKEKSEQ